MFQKYLIVALFAFAAGCSKAHPRKGGGFLEDFAIPGKIEIDPVRLVKVDDAQYAAHLEMLKSIKPVNALRPHILISRNESDKSKERRDEAFAKLTAAQKSAVGVANSRCQVTDDTPSDKPAFNLLGGSELNLKQVLRTENKPGQVCPADLRNDTHTRWIVISTDDSGESGVTRLDIHNLLYSEYKDPQMAEVAGATRVELRTHATGKMEIEPETSRTYARVGAQGVADLLNNSKLEIYVKGEFLELSHDQREVILYMAFGLKDKVYNYALHAEDVDGVPVITKFFAGDRSLTAAEMNQAGVPELARLLMD